MFYLITLIGYIIYADDENPNEISNYYRELIEIGVFNQLTLLESINENVYNIIIGNLSPNDIIENYYYGIAIYIRNDNNIRQFTIREYNVLKNLPEYLNWEIFMIVYSVYYYEYFFNKFRHIHFFGNPTTGKCFSIFFNENYEFIRIVYLS